MRKEELSLTRWTLDADDVTEAVRRYVSLLVDGDCEADSAVVSFESDGSATVTFCNRKG